MRNLFIDSLAEKAGIPPEEIIPYTDKIGKISPSFIASHKERKGKLVLVTAMTPTKFGEGKTLTSISLAEGLGRLNEPALLCLREPAIGPVFGVKGGATGSGKATIEPSDKINLHFTGDIHALTSANNLISAVIDNSIFQGNPLNIDPNQVLWHRALDMNDRALRKMTIAEGGKIGTPRNEEFVITVASELMAILCLAIDRDDFISRLENIAVAKTYEGKTLHVKDLSITKALMSLLEDALLPNLVATQEGNPVLIHGGPFANIAHGANSLIATNLALSLSPLVITEAGFGADLGAEKFMDIVAPIGNLHPDAVILVGTIKALKLHGGVPYEGLKEENPNALKIGLANIARHYENLQKYGVPVIISLNHFDDDYDSERKEFEKWAKNMQAPYAYMEGYQKGGEGAVSLAKVLLNTLKNNTSCYHPLYSPQKANPFSNIEIIAKEIYRTEVEYSPLAKEKLNDLVGSKFASYPICMAKTPNSFTDDPKKLNAPDGESIYVRDVRLYEGARLIVPLLKGIVTMPGLPKVPAAVKMEDE